MTFHKYISILCILIISACGSSKDAVDNSSSKPEWVSNRPIDPYSYIGIGVSRVQADGSHLQRAKNAALSDLASEISVEISSTSLLHQIEQNRSFREEYRAQTELNSLETIDDFELVGSYEYQGYYYVQYKLDKATYARQRAARKSTAVQKALSFYNQALQAKKDYNIQASLTHTMSALGEVKLYLNEPIQAVGVEGDFGVRLYSFVNELLESIRLEPLESRIQLIRYQDNSSLFAFTTTTTEGAPLANIPVYLYYTGGFLRENMVKSNEKGEVYTVVPKATNPNETERLEADINFVALAENATRDPLLRMLLTRHPGDRAEIIVNVRPPLVFIESIEIAANSEMANPPIAQALRSFLLTNSFSTTQYREQADLVVVINASTSTPVLTDKMYRTNLAGEIIVTNKQGEMVRSLPLSNYQGIQLSAELAARDAYRRAVQDLQDHEFRKLLIN